MKKASTKLDNYVLTETDAMRLYDTLIAVSEEKDRVRDRIADGAPKDMRRLYRGADGVLWLEIVSRTEFSNGVPIWMIHTYEQPKRFHPDCQHTAKWVYPKQVCDWIEDDDDELWSYMPPSMVMCAHLDAEKAVFAEKMAAQKSDPYEGLEE